jgi:hypothetical protein
MELNLESEIQSGNLSLIKKIKTAIFQKEFAKTKDLLKGIIAFDVLEPSGYNLMGIVFEYERQFSLAKKMYRAALAVDPSYTPATENLDRICQLEYIIDGINYG